MTCAGAVLATPALALLAALAAGGEVGDAGPTPPAPRLADAAPPALRLGEAARPVRYALDLRIVPEDETFAGTEDVDVELRLPTALLWLNAKDLVIDEATLERGAARSAVRVVAGGEDNVGFDFGRPLGPGAVRLHVAWHGHFRETDTNGLFREREDGLWYAYTQFEAIAARRAFPCFDEPSFKVPWTLTLHVPAADVAAANAPVERETDEPGGLREVRFAETKPLPSYLVAFAVGPFDVVDAGRVGRKATPTRVLVPCGRAGDTAYAVATTRELLARIEDWFGVPYPYDKLDHVSIPDTVGFGAMENAGLITYNQRALLERPAEATIEHRRRLATIVAHEIAHQWFGDLVTPSYWDEIWLNESFATWMETKIVGAWKPEWDMDVSQVRRRQWAVASDALAGTRRVREPVKTKDDIESAFDGIAYAKGSALLAMFESWMGEERFKRGVVRYVAAHANGNATSHDFLEALGGKEVAAAFTTFLEQPGIPLVTVDLACAAGGPPRLVLTQGRYAPLGWQGTAAERWTIPVCVTDGGADGRAGRACALMRDGTQEMILPDAAACAGGWVLANDGMRGYYIAAYGGDLLRRLVAGGAPGLTTAEKVGLLGDLGALARAGKVPLGEALAIAERFGKETPRHLVVAASRIVSDVRAGLVPDDLVASYARFVRATFGARARSLGFKAVPAEDDEVRLLRTALLDLVGVAGEDEDLRREARRLALAWLDDRRAVDAEVLPSVLAIAGTAGDRALFDAFLGAARRSRDRQDRRRLLGALGSFRDRALVREALDLVLDPSLDVRETFAILAAAAEEPRTRALVYDFVKANFDRLAERLPETSVAGLPGVAAAPFCDAEHARDAEAFFRGRSTRAPGGVRKLDQAIERIGLCAAYRQAQAASLAEFLRKY